MPRTFHHSLAGHVQGLLVSRKLWAPIVALIVLVAVMTSQTPIIDAQSTTITVNSTADTTTSGDGQCTLREALINANSNSDTTGGDCQTGGADDHIVFTIGAGGPQIITLASVLPTITNRVVIDGASQPGYAGTPLITLSANGLSGTIITVQTSNTTLNDLIITNAPGTVIRLINADNATIDRVNIAWTGSASRTGTGLVVDTGSDTVLIRNVNTTLRSYGIVVSGGHDVQVRDSVLANTNQALQMDGVLATTLPSGVQVVGNSYTGSANGVYLLNMPNLVVSDTGVAGTTVDLRDSGGAVTLPSVAGTALHLSNTDNATVDHATLSWTGSTSRSGNGLYVDSGSDGVLIRNVDATLRSYGILVSGGHDVQVRDSVLANTNQALQMDSVLQTTLPSGVQVVGNSYTGSANGVYLLNMPNLVVSDTGVAGTTVDLRDSGGAVTLPSVAGTALYLSNTDNATVDHATLSWTGSASRSGTGLNVDTGSDGVVIRNVNATLRSYGILVSGGHDMQVRDSVLANTNQALQMNGVLQTTLPSGVQVVGNSYTGSANGVYLLNMPNLVVSDTGVAGTTVDLRDSGGAVTLPSVAGTALHLSNTDNATVDHATLSWTGSASRSGNGLYVDSGSDGVVIRNVNATLRSYGILVSGGHDVQVRDSVLANTTQALQMDSVLQTTLPSGVQVVGNSYTGSANGVYLLNMPNLVVSDTGVAGTTVDLRDSGGAVTLPSVAGTVLRLSNTDNATVDHATLSWTGSASRSGYGLYVDSGSDGVLIRNVNATLRSIGILVSGGHDVQVRDSVLTNTNQALQMDSVLQTTLPSGVQVVGNSYTGSANGVYLLNMPNLVVSDTGVAGTTVDLRDSGGAVTLPSVAGTALHLSNTDNATVDHATLSWTGSASRSGYGLYVDSGSDGVVIRNVNATLRSYGILVSGGHDVQVRDSVLANTNQALQMDSVLQTTLPSGVQVVGNSYTGSANGVYLLNMPNLVVSDTGVAGTTVDLRDSGGAVTLPSVAGTVLRLSNTDNATVDHATLSWTGSASRSGYGLYVDSGSDGVVIRNVNATLRSIGILVSGGHDMQVRDSVLANTNQALQMDSVLQTTLPSGVQVVGNSYTGSANGVYLLNMPNLVVSDTGVAGTTVDLRDSGGAVTLPSVAGTALYLSNTDNATVDHATLSWTGSASRSGTGLYVDNGSDNLIVRNSQVKNRSSGATLNQSATPILTCSVYGNNTFGVQLASNVTNARLTDNRFQANGTGVNWGSTSIALDAKNNYWGATNGPSNLGGSGDSYINNVTASPFSSAPAACVNTVPTASQQTVTTSEDTSLIIQLTGIDPDTDPLTYTIASLSTVGALYQYNSVAPGNLGAQITLAGTAVSDPSHRVVFVPAPNGNGNPYTTFTFTVADAALTSSPATITLVVTPVNDAPVASNSTLTATEDTTASGTLSATDVDGDALTYSIVANGTKGVVAITNAATGAYTYTPNANAIGSDTFTFKVHDGTVDSNTATVTVTISPVNDVPVASNSTLTATEDTTASAALNATDVDGDALTYSIVANGTKGVVAITNAATGAYTYTPNADAIGSDSFTFKVNDGAVDSNVATVTVTITAVNDAPVATDASLSTNEDTVATGTLQATDVDGDALTYSIVTNGTKGVAAITNPATGAYTYTPNADANGSDSFTFKVNDGTVDSNIATVTVTITPVNDAPVASDGTLTATEDTTASGTLTATDVDGDALTYSIVANGTKGVAAITNAATGAYTYTPNANATGSDTFTFKVHDGTVDSNTATVTVTISPVNDAPIGGDDSLSSIAEDSGARTIPFATVLANDSTGPANESGQTLTITGVNSPTGGTVGIVGGTVVFTPTTDFNGTAGFTYTLQDDGTTNGAADPQTDTATVTFSITPVNDPPSATDDTLTVAEDSGATVVNVLANDSPAPDTGETLTVTAVTQPANGTVTLTSGVVDFTPAANFNGSTSFTYTISDGNSGTATATVTVTVTPVNDSPVAMDGSLTTNEDTTTSAALNATDGDSDALIYSIVTNGTKGVATITNAATGAYTYTPNADAIGSDSFTFKVNDGAVDSNVATVTVTITAVNDAPVATDASLSTNEDTVATGTLQATDVDGDALTYSIVTNGTKGVAAITNPATGAYTYTPNADANGSDSFTFKVNDGTVDSNIATVTVTITPVNDAPVASDGTLTATEDTTASGTLTATDVDGDALTYSIVANGTKGVVAITNAATGAYTYTPNADATGSDSFTFKVHDSTVDSTVATITVTITPANDAPVASDGTLTTTEDTTASAALNATDVDGDALTYSIVTNGTKGVATVTNAATGAYTYTPNADANGSDSFTFKVNDGTVDSNIATVTVTITPVNDAPVASDGTLTATEDTTASGTLTATDVDGDALTYSIVANGTKGVAAITNAATGAYTYTPNADATGSDSFTFKVHDGTVDSTVATITVTIAAVNDAPVASNGTLTATEDTTASGTLTATDVDGDALTYSIVTNGTKGVATVTNAATGAYTYTPNADANGSDSFTFKVNDGTVDSNIATVTVTITPVNDAPVASDGTLTATEDTTASGTLTATDVDGDALTYSIVANGTKGVAAITNAATGAYTYTPNADATGSDSFTFKVHDSTVDSTVATITVTIAAVNDAPSFTKGADQSVAEDASAQSVSTWPSGVRAGPVDESGQVVTFLVTNDTNALFAVQPAIAADGTLTYTPAANAHGSAIVTVQAHDDGGTANGGMDTSASQTFTITLTAVNDAPVATDGSLAVTEDTTANGTLSATDVDGDVLTYSIVANGTKGVAAITNAATGAYTYTPNVDATGTDSFTFKVHDGTGDSNVATVTVTITPDNDAPVASAGSATTTEDTATTGTLVAVDGDSDPLTYSIVANGTKGVATITNAATGAYTYTPSADANGSDSFTFNVNDGTVDSNIATITVTITPVNDAPSVTTGADQSVLEDAGAQRVSTWATSISAGPADESGQVVTFLVTNDTNGLFAVQPAIAADGTLSYTPAANAHGSATVTVQVHDEGGTANGGMDTSASQTFTITVVSVNDAPTLNQPADQSIDEESGAHTVSLDGISAGPADEHGQTLSVTATSSNPALIPNPSVTYTSPDATGAVAFTPVAGMSGSATITVTVTDNGGSANGGVASLVRTFVVFVGSVNNRPTLDLPVDLTVLEDAAAQTVNLTNIGVGATTEGDQSLTVTVTSSNPTVVPNPTVSYTSPNATGSLSFTPALNANGTATITVTIRDTGGTANGGIDVIERTFVVTVTPINDAPDVVVGANQRVTGVMGPQRVERWASGFVAGPADESDQQVVGYTVVTNSNPTLFAVAPAVAVDGTLTYTPQVGVSGTATISLTVQDSGGTAFGGVDTSAVKTFTITVAGTYRVYLPFQARAGTPDLVVSTLSLLPSKTSFGTNEAVEMQVVVTNQGDGSAGPFWVDLSLNPDHPPTTANQLWNKHCALKTCFGLAWYVDGLAPGASISLTSKNVLKGYAVWPGTFAAGTTDLYAYVDSFNPNVAAGLVTEGDEANNQFHLGGLKVIGNTSAAGVQSATDLLDRPIHLK